jgi:hypothetical protein
MMNPAKTLALTAITGGALFFGGLARRLGRWPADPWL